MLNVWAAIFNILAVVGYIFLALIFLLCWIIIVPRSVYVEYEQQKGISVKIRVFLFKLSIYPSKFLEKFASSSEIEHENSTQTVQDEILKETTTVTDEMNTLLEGQNSANGSTSAKTENEHEKAKKAKKSKEKEQKPNKDYLSGLPEGFELIKLGLSTAKGVVKILLRGIKIKDVCFTLPLKGQDAFETQQLYGKVTSSFYIFNTFLQRYVRIYYKNPVFIADFADNYKNSVYFYCKIQASPSIMLVVGWYLFKTYRKTIKNGTGKRAS